MKVKELIEKLQKLDQENEINIWHDDHKFIVPEIKIFCDIGQYISNDHLLMIGTYIMEAN